LWIISDSSATLGGAMLSIGKLGQGQADYYLHAVAQGIEDYYTGAGEAPGWWTGAAADELDVFGQVEGELLHRALSGQHPATGELLAKPPRGAIRVPGFDLTFSAPKSVSLLFALADADVSREVRNAHEAAVQATLGYMERQAAVARRGRGGCQSVLGNGFLGAAFRHRTSRAGDPQLHTHVLVANMTRGPDGRWTALDARRLYANAKTGGYLYQAHLRAELVRRLGVGWTPVRRGQAEVAGVPPTVLRAFSRRRAEIEEQMAERGERSSRAAQVAALDSRQAKDYSVAAHELSAEWRERASALGLDTGQLRELLGLDEPRALDALNVERIKDELAGPHGLTRQRSSFNRRDVVQAWCERLAQGADVDVVERLVDKLLAGDRVVALAQDVRELTHSDVVRRSDGRIVPATADERRYSTPELLALEQGIIDRALAGRAAGAGVVSGEAVDAALAGRPELSVEQAEMVRRLTRDGDAVAVVVGRAGTGKTFALDVARQAWQADGHRVIGAALARRAAQELQDGAGIEATSIAALLHDLRERPEFVLDARTVLVIDEAGMVGTRQLAEVVDHAATADAKVVLVGDHRQLPEIEAGGAFRGLVTRTHPVMLHENRRQQHQWEREALELLSEGHAGEALRRYHEHGRIVVGERAADVRGRLVDDWWHATEGGDEAIMVALRRADVADLNGRARALMAAAGRLGPDSTQVAGRPFAVGDHVVCLSNARALGVLNGTRGVITRVDADVRGLCGLWLRTHDGAELHLPASYLHDRSERTGPTLDYGYAITGHKAQGMTTGRAFVLGTEDLYREWGYVALSRGRFDNRLYIVAPDLPERDEHAPATAPRLPLDAVAQALARSQAQTLATDARVAAALVDRPTDELERERRQLATGLGQGHRATSELRELVAQVEGAESAAEAAAERRRELEGTRRGRRAGTGELARDRAVEAQARERVEQLRRREQQLRVAAEWETRQHPSEELARRYALITEELARRAVVRDAALVLDPPRYLTDELGPVPQRLSERHAWREAARRIERYRQRFDIRNPDRALAGDPRDFAERAARRELRRELDEIQQLGRSGPERPDLARGHER
jgi:Ti-type conjugative transfer relaxase TraA